MKQPIILAVETSCDETSVAIIDGNNKILSLVTNTQIEAFASIGGVVPEMASRMHVDNILPIYYEALDKANISVEQVNYFAVTSGPGLVGALLIGVNFVKTLALIHNKEIISVNHLKGHIHALDIEHDVQYPHLSLIVSGGHTELIYMPKRGEYQKIGQTLDDAAGESYDKVARMLGVGYPGGPIIDKLAKTGNPTYKLPMPKNDGSLDFSFSGLKSACYNTVNNLKMKGEVLNQTDFACSFQTSVVNTLINKLVTANDMYKPNQISIVGGVSANSELQKRAKDNFSNVIIPSLIYSTDNAAMIASAALVLVEKNEFANKLLLNANPSMSI